MSKKPFILGITPARGGSKSIPKKNIKPIAGKPLIAWTIEAAKASKLLDRFVVSTEDPEIGRVAIRHGAEVLPRPKSLATDSASTLVVLEHALRVIPADIVVVLQCTSPVRGPGLIDRCIRKFLASKADSLGTIFPDLSYEYGDDQPRRQLIKPRLLDNGNVYVIKGDLIRKGERYGRKLATYENTREESVEIDEPYDFWLAEKILKERKPR